MEIEKIYTKFPSPPPMSRNTGGRPQLPLIANNFKFHLTLGNKSNRHRFTCKHCGPDSAAIENRDNRCLKHLSSVQTCPNAPEEVRRAALIALMDRGHVQNSAAAPLLVEDGDGVQDATDTGRVSKKRKGDTLNKYFVPSLPQSQREAADIKLFRCVEISAEHRRDILNMEQFLRSFKLCIQSLP
jgi:hypothetical protein